MTWLISILLLFQGHLGDSIKFATIDDDVTHYLQTTRTGNIMDQPLIIEPTGTADSSIIWLHGLGATKRDFESVAQILQKQVIPNTRFILPQAPIQPVTLNGGLMMSSWYDIIDLSFPRQISEDELNASAQIVIDLIIEEHSKGIPLDRIILAGFSQGGAVVLHTAFIAYSGRIGGVIALSTYAPTFIETTKISEKQKTIPSLHLHGTHDNVVAIQYGKEAFEFLTKQGIKTTWHDYPMMHEVNNDELSDIATWLHQRLIK